MTDKEWHNKEGKVVRKNPRCGGHKCNRPFIAPRRVVEETDDSDVQIITESEVQEIERLQDKPQDLFDSEVHLVTETENARNIDGRERQLDSDTTESTLDIFKPPSMAQLDSDTTASTPDIFKSPEQDGVMTLTEPVQTCSVDVIEKCVIHASPARRNPFNSRNFRGVKTVLETHLAESESDSKDDILVARLLRPRTKTTLTTQQIADCQEGPKGERAIGVTVAKKFGEEEFRGNIGNFRGQRGRYIYHVTYTDGDEEELSQKELRDYCYLLALAPQIEAEWAI
jgi:hypothetical protein